MKYQLHVHTAIFNYRSKWHDTLEAALAEHKKCIASPSVNTIIDSDGNEVWRSEEKATWEEERK